VLQTGVDFCAVVSDAGLVFCFRIFTLVAAAQNKEGFKLGSVRVSVYEYPSVHLSIFKYTTDDNNWCRSRAFQIWEVWDSKLTAALLTYIFCSFPQFFQENGGLIYQNT
jgi:hypothetical protein